MAISYTKNGSSLERFLSSHEFEASGGTATAYGTVNNMTKMWQFDAASTEIIAVEAGRLPSHWTTYDVILEWMDISTTGGDVVWRVQHGTFGNGEAVSAASLTDAAKVTATTSGQYTRVVTTLASGLSVVSTETLALRIVRFGGDAADTLGNDAAVSGVVLKKAS